MLQGKVFMDAMCHCGITAVNNSCGAGVRWTLLLLLLCVSERERERERERIMWLEMECGCDTTNMVLGMW